MKRVITMVILIAVCLSTLNAFAETESPISIGIFPPLQLVHSTESVHGIRFSLLFGLNDEVSGMDFGLINRTDSELNALQLGLINLNEDVSAVQLGLYNSNYKFKGIQFGLINRTESLNGIQIGLLNFNGNKTPFKFMPLINYSH